MDLAVYLENVVKGFRRYHKYTLGTEMRNQSRAIVGLIIRANSERDRQSTLEALRDEIEHLKVTIRIAKEFKAFRNFNSFTVAVEAAISLSRQSEGWLKSCRGKV
jgi:hypothetical protein